MQLCTSSHPLRHRALFFACSVAFASACAGGQSGNEGELPGAPCAWEGARALFRGEVLALASECVGGGLRPVVDVHVDEVVRAIDYTILLDGSVAPGSGWPRAGEVLHGMLAGNYAYTHTFQAGAAVAVLASSAEPLPQLELMLLEGERIRIDWAGVHYDATFDDLTRADCDSRELARRDTLPHDRPRSQRGEIPVAPDRPSTTCTP